MIDKLAFFGGLCLFLSAVEYAIPKPLPFLRLGLANLPVLIALGGFSSVEIFLLILVKILVQGIMGGTIFSYIFIFSLCGSLASGLLMLSAHRLLFRHKLISNIGISLLGAMGNAFAQLICARFFLFGENSRYVAPLLFVSSTLTGFLLGLFANHFEKKSRWFLTFMKNDGKAKIEHPKQIQDDEKNQGGNKVQKIFFLISALILILFLLIPKNLFVKTLSLAVIFVLLEIKKRGKVRILPSLFILLSVVISNLLVPFGKILFTVEKWHVLITQGALFAGLERGVVLVGFLFFSQLIIDKNIILPGALDAFFKRVLGVFDILSGEKISFEKSEKISGLTARIDEKLLSLYGIGREKSGEEK